MSGDQFSFYDKFYREVGIFFILISFSIEKMILMIQKLGGGRSREVEIIIVNLY